MVLHGPFDNLSHSSESFPVGPAGPEDLGRMRLFIRLKRECAHRTDAVGEGCGGPCVGISMTDRTIGIPMVTV